MNRRTRSGIRHDDRPIPADWADTVRSQRERASRWIAWAAIAFAILAFGSHLI